MSLNNLNNFFFIKIVIGLLLAQFIFYFNFCTPSHSSIPVAIKSLDVCSTYKFLESNKDSLRPISKRPLKSLSLKSFTLSESDTKKITLSLGDLNKTSSTFIASTKVRDSLCLYSQLKYSKSDLEFNAASCNILIPEVCTDFKFRKKDLCNYDIQYSDVDQGFPTSFVMGITNDKKGNIWIATEGNGLLRYDGKTILKYGIVQGLKSEVVNLVYNDSKENIWFVSGNNTINKFDGCILTTYNIKWPRSNDLIRFITEDKSGNIFFGTNFNGIITLSGKTFSQIKFKDLSNRVNYTCGKMNKRGDMWFSTSSSTLIKFDGSNYFSIQLRDNPGTSGITAFDFDTKDDLWFGYANKGLFSFRNDSLFNIVDSSKTLLNEVNFILIDNDNNKWVSVLGNGLVNLKNNDITTFTIKDGLPKDEYINCIVKGLNNTIWAGTYGGGLTKLKLDVKYLGINNGLKNDFITALKIDESGHKWIGTSVGNIIELNGNKLIDYSMIDKIKPNYVFDFLAEKNKIWIGTMNNGFIIKEGKVFKHYGYDEKKDPKLKISSFYRDSKGTLWMAVFGNGVVEYKNDTLHFHNQKTGLSSNYVRTICEDEDHNIWFGTQNGITVYDRKNFRYLNEKSGFPYSVIWNITKTSDGSLWLSTFGKGLLRYHKGNFHLLNGKKYLPNNAVMSVLEDTLNNRLFVGTEKGLALIDVNSVSTIRCSKCGICLDENVYTFIHNSDGIKSENFSRNCSGIDKSGRIWWGGSSGITSVLNNKFMLNSAKPNVEFTAIKLNDKSYNFNLQAHELKLQDNTIISYTGINKFTGVPNNLVLPYYVNNIHLKFSADDFLSGSDVQYQYKINTTDTVWSNWKKDNFQELIDLNPGKYNIYIRAKNITNKISDSIVFSLTILPPWWKSDMFYIIYFVACITLIALIFKIRLHFIKKQRNAVTKALLNTQEEERLRISRELHDSVGQELLYLNMHTNGKYANEIQPILEEVRNISRNLSPTRLKETNLKALLISLVENISAKTNIYLTYDIEYINLKNEFTKINIYRIAQEALSNVIKHSKAKNARITFKVNNKQFDLTIQDDGIGISSENKNKGVGLISIQERSHLIRAELKISSSGAGTTIKIIVKNYE